MMARDGPTRHPPRHSCAPNSIARLGLTIGRFGVPRFLAVPRDGRWALASHIDNWERDIMVLDGLR